jgi:hypothetical protein
MGAVTRTSILVVLQILLLVAAPTSAQDWTARTVEEMAAHARQLAPPGLGRQIDRHKAEMKRGIQLASQTVEASGLSEPIDDIIRRQSENAIQRITQHQPFSEIIFQLGVVAYFVALANDPVRYSPEDRPRPNYAADYYGYLEGASRRFAVLYYGEGRDFEDSLALQQLIDRSLARGKQQAAMVAQEYRRIGAIDGRQLFDDRSTAFGVGSLAYSHAVSDIVGVMRYIWIRAGGGDFRNLPPLDADHLILISPGAQTEP